MIDFHCHIDLYPEPQGVVRDCVAHGLYALSVTTTPSAWRVNSKMISDAPRIRLALGLHPQLAHERRGELPLFEALLPEARYVGEIGLDGGPELKAYWADQTYVFERILSACKSAGGRIMTIHSRRAAAAVLDRLEQRPNAGIPILHWYSGGHRDLKRAIDLGCWFSVGPAMLAGEKGREVVSRLPRERVLTETDGPFAIIDGGTLFPWDVAKAEVTLAELWKIDRDGVSAVLRANLRRLTTLPVVRQSAC